MGLAAEVACEDDGECGTGGRTPAVGGLRMEQTTFLALLVGAAAVGILATILILNRYQATDDEAGQESPYAPSTEGMKRCPSCGVANLVTDDTCSSCGRRLPE